MIKGIQTDHLLILPEADGDYTEERRGEIVFLSELNTETKPLNLKVGDKVLHRENAGVSLKINGEKYRILKITDIYVNI